MESFLPAIGGLARRFDVGGPVQRTELLQEGVAGLLFAARRYDPRMETPFWAYASFWVRKAMQELVADVTRPVALSDHAVRGLARVKAARRDHLQAYRAEPTSAQLAAATGLSSTQVDRLLAIDRTPRSFDEPLGHDEGATATFGDTVFKPRGIAHAFWNPGDEPVRFLEIITPSGFEQYFADVEPLLTADGPPDIAALAAVQARYALSMDLESAQPLVATHGLNAPPG